MVTQKKHIERYKQLESQRESERDHIENKLQASQKQEIVSRFLSTG